MKQVLKKIFYSFFPLSVYILFCRIRHFKSEQGMPSINAARFFSLLGNKRRTFVQIGANDGVKNDPIHDHILKSSWSGVLVEPLPDFYEKLKSNYQAATGLRFENSGVSDVSGDLDFYYLPAQYNDPDWLQQIGSFSKEAILLNLESLPNFIPYIEVKKIPVLTLHQLFLKYEISSVHLLLIDAEGFEKRILEGLELSKVRPNYIFYEWGCMEPADNEYLKKMLIRLGYMLFSGSGDILAVK
jgi:FkbM family methyltransferase